MYAVCQPDGTQIFTGTQAECWQYMKDEGLPASYYVVKL